MRKIKTAASLCVLALMASGGIAHSDETSIEEKSFIPSSQVASTLASDVCSVCHGAAGISKWPFIPSLAGQDKTYLENQLKAFRMRARADHYAQAAMWSMAQPLKDEEISALAQYYSSLKPPSGDPAAHSALVDIGIGKRIFEKGLTDRSVPACNSCHLQNGQGDVDIPLIAGQHADYAARELREYRSGFRSNDLMSYIAGKMTDDEIEAFADYSATLNASIRTPAAAAAEPAAPAGEPAGRQPERKPGEKKKVTFHSLKGDKTFRCAVASIADGKMALDCSVLKAGENGQDLASDDEIIGNETGPISIVSPGKKIFKCAVVSSSAGKAALSCPVKIRRAPKKND